MAEEEQQQGEEDQASSIAALEEQFATADAALERARRHELRLQDGASRTKLARIIIYAFVGMIAALFLYASVPALLGSCKDCTGEVPKVLIWLGEFTSSVMLPVVTLVLGYYFGTRQAESAD